MHSANPGRLEPSSHQQTYHRDRLDQTFPYPVGKIGIGLQLRFDAIPAQDCRLALAPARTPETLTEARYRWWCANLRNALYCTDVDTEFQRSGADGARRPGAVLECLLRVLAEFLRQASMVRPEFVRISVSFASAAQKVGIGFDEPPAVGEY